MIPTERGPVAQPSCGEAGRTPSALQVPGLRHGADGPTPTGSARERVHSYRIGS